MEAVVMAEIDPVKYGVLWERVQNYERRFDEMSNKMDKMEANVEKLVAGRFFCFVLDSNDKVWGLGLRNGCETRSGSMSIGTARSDLYGYTLNIESVEAFLPMAVTPSTDSADVLWPFDAVTGTGTITVTNPA